MTTLLSINAVTTVVTSDVVINTLLPITLQLVTDPVPNIRFNVAKTLNSISAVIEPSNHALVAPALEKLLQDPDPDVKFFATQAWNAIKS